MHRHGRGRARSAHWHRVIPRFLSLITWLVFISAIEARGDSKASVPSIEPSTIVLKGADARQQVAVTLSLGRRFPARLDARLPIHHRAEGIATITDQGVVRPLADGYATLRAFGLDFSVEAEIHVQRFVEPRAASFRTEIMPLLSKAGCNIGACHGNLSGKGGFRLSLRGDDPDFDFQSLTREQFGRRVNPVSPRQSLVFLKPTAGVAHEGGLRFGPQSIEAATLLRWIAASGRDDRAEAPRVRSLRVFPLERFATPGTPETAARGDRRIRRRDDAGCDSSGRL